MITKIWPQISLIDIEGLESMGSGSAVGQGKFLLRGALRTFFKGVGGRARCGRFAEVFGFS